jgi:8-oxo-dGTP diphosphatase
LIYVVAGIISNAKQEVLVSYRPSHVPQGNMWEFPGGKIEPGETAYDALVRELQEELNITVISAEFFARNQHVYGDRHIHLEVFKIKEYEGTPRGHEGQKIQWVSVEVLAELTFPEANQVIVKMLS